MGQREEEELHLQFGGLIGELRVKSIGSGFLEPLCQVFNFWS